VIISKTDICNMALANIGSPPIQSIEGPPRQTDLASVKACKLRYDEARLEALAGNLWNFASMWATGARLAIDPKPPFSYVFQYPPDALRVFEIYRAKGLPPIPFEVTDRPDAPGKLIHCNLEAPTFIYVREKDDPTTFDFDFIQAMSWLLASKIAMPVTKNIKLQQEAWKMWLTSNSAAVANDENEEVQDTDVTATYQDAR